MDTSFSSKNSQGMLFKTYKNQKSDLDKSDSSGVEDIIDQKLNDIELSIWVNQNSRSSSIKSL